MQAQEQHARDHFGRDCSETPVCLMRVPGEHNLLRALRDAQDELAGYRAEDTELMRALQAQASDHSVAIAKAEQKGYDAALRDIESGKIEPDHAARILRALA